MPIDFDAEAEARSLAALIASGAEADRQRIANGWTDERIAAENLAKLRAKFARNV
jgi:hypothetical protein